MGRMGRRRRPRHRRTDRASLVSRPLPESTVEREDTERRRRRTVSSDDRPSGTGTRARFSPTPPPPPSPKLGLRQYLAYHRRAVGLRFSSTNRMLASYNRYTFKPHHFILAHDVVLDSVELNTETYDDDNIECNKENDIQFTWDFPANSSNLFHSSNTSLESLNLKNAVRSKLGAGAKAPLHEQIKRHKADMMETMCSLRIEDFAKIGTDCVRLNLDSVIGRKNLKKQQQQAAGSTTRPDWPHQERLDRTNEATPVHKRNAPVSRDMSSGSSHRVSRRLPETPNTRMRDTAYQLSRDPVPVSSLIRTPSLAEELEAALLAEKNPEHADADNDNDSSDALRSSLPDGFRLNLSLRSDDEESDFSVDLSQLGSPEQIDPVNKYGGFFFGGFAAKEKRPACRKSCCFSETDSNRHRSAKDGEDVTMSPAVKTVRKQRDEVVSHHRNTPESADLGRHARLVKTDCSDDAARYSDEAGADSDLRVASYNLGSGKDCLANKVRNEKEKCYKNSDDIHQNITDTCKAVVGKKFSPKTSVTGDVVCTSVDFDIDEIDATHRGCHKFVPRHQEELAIEIGDYIYVQVEDDDLWCEGVNLRTRQRGIFPAAYAMDLSLFDDDSHNSKFFVKYLGSIEVGFHKGNDVLCQAINKLTAARLKTADSNPPPLCCLEITEHGVKMTDRSTKKVNVASVSDQLKARLRSSVEQGSSGNDHLFLLKNISFCGYHPKNDRYFGFITKHPLEMRFACHVFQNDKSSTVIAEAIRDAFRKFYQEYLAYVYPTEDIYLE